MSNDNVSPGSPAILPSPAPASRNLFHALLFILILVAGVYVYWQYAQVTKPADIPPTATVATPAPAPLSNQTITATPTPTPAPAPTTAR